ncbi:hypothetical protein RHSIM_Rhsim07G0125600 [Rhododendron simsii]|uniref:Uncharacterized protein n=1 Tax=Rhododendron simsii TaxID=118357 RepID=A0A834GLK6_RHOSS|nr:hypothetical protein RHSIM_Rhsim07G0125600 [Rhododendron simsii]
MVVPDYDKPFVLECDASGKGLGAVLMQKGRPIAFYSNALSPTRLGLSTYEKELLVVVLSITKWTHYLLGRKFLIKTDHQSLKFLLEQMVTTPMQQKWLSKLMGFDYEVVYKTGKTNVVTDALSRMGQGFESTAADQGTMAAMTVKHHASPVGGHSGGERTYQWLKQAFFWKGMKQVVLQYAAGCDICQRHKNETVASPGLLQQLPIPARLWSDISMDFIEGLPSSSNKIITFSSSIVCPIPSYTVFTSTFWKELFRLQVAAVDNMLQDRSTILKLLKEHLASYQHRMKQIADQHSLAKHLRLIARYTSYLIKVRLGSIGVIAEPNVEVSKASSRSIAISKGLDVGLVDTKATMLICHMLVSHRYWAAMLLLLDHR